MRASLLTLVLCVACPSFAGSPNDAAAPATPPKKVVRKSRLELAKEGWALALGQYRAGACPMEAVLRWNQWLFEAERAADAKPAASQRLTRLGELEDLVVGRVQAGLTSTLDLLAVQYARAAAESE